jgi:ubiquinone/menaquinone biosynthesis C-methylase UbiE
MPKTAAFERQTERYENWFETHDAVYRSELEALRRLRPKPGDGIEIGVGTGRFAAALGLQVGVDPAREMLRRARDRGIDVVSGVAESLPFSDESFDTALLVTTICFVDDIPQTLSEARRVLRPDGSLVLGFIDADSPVGRTYRETQADNPFYRDAVFVSTDELVDALQAAGFTEFEYTQTLYQSPADVDEREPIDGGYGDGSFVGIKATP